MTDMTVCLMQHALKKRAAGHSAYFVENGEEAIAYLTGEGKYGDRSKYPLPNIARCLSHSERLAGA